MGTYEELKAAIQQVIRTNGNNEITGALLQNALLSIVNVVGANATFAGIATPNTNPGTSDQNVFYLATEAGTYVNFGGIQIAEGEAVILSNKTGNWTKTTSGFATQEQFNSIKNNIVRVKKVTTYSEANVGDLYTLDYNNIRLFLNDSPLDLRVVLSEDIIDTNYLNKDSIFLIGLDKYIWNGAKLAKLATEDKIVLAEDFNKNVDIYNVTENVPLATGYYNKETAILAVPREYRKSGLIVKYASSAYFWKYIQYYKVGVSDFSNSTWSVMNNWRDITLDNSTIWENDLLADNPVLACIKSVKLKALRQDAVFPEVLCLTYLSAGNIEQQQIILNINKSIASSGNKQQSVVLNTIVSDYSNVVFNAEKDNIYYEIIADRTLLITPLNKQIGSEDWIPINYQSIPASIPVYRNPLIGTTRFNNDTDPSFLIDLSIIGGDPENYIYYFYWIDVNYNGDNLIVISRRNKITGESEIITALNIDNYIDSNGYVYYDGGVNYSDYTYHRLKIRCNWNAIKDKYDGQRIIMGYNISPFTDVVFNGGVGTFQEKTNFERLRELDVYPNGAYFLAGKGVAKLSDTIPLPNNQYDKGNGILQSVINMESYNFSDGNNYAPLFDLRYINLGNIRQFLEITPDEKIWFVNKQTGNLEYCNNENEVINEQFTIVDCGDIFVNGDIKQYPCALKMNKYGELIVITYRFSVDWGTENNVCRIWKSDTNFKNWQLKLTYKTAYETLTYPDWSLDLQGDRIIAAGYGAHTTNYDNAIWNIYYSPDSGNTWYNNLFRLGEMIDIDGYSPSDRIEQMHIHGVAIDPYRERLMVMNGDTEVSIWVTTNLKEWENNPNRQNNWQPNNINTLHWKRLSTDDGFKPTSAIGLPNNILMGSDSLPNGFERINLISEFSDKNECAISERAYAIQRVNEDATGDFSFYGYTLNKHSNKTPVICSLMYVGGVYPEALKRNMVYVTDDGYRFSKIWQDDRDVVSYNGESFTPLRARTLVQSRINNKGYVFIQTCDSRFNDLINGYPAPTNELTLVIGKLI